MDEDVVVGSTVLCFADKSFGDVCSDGCEEVPADVLVTAATVAVLCEVAAPETKRRLPATELGSHSRTV